MTTLVGIRRASRVWIGSDTLLTSHEHRLGHISKTALIPHDSGADTCIAISGPSTAIHAIQDIVAETSFGPWISTLEVYKGLCEIHSYLVTNHFIKPVESEDDAFESSRYQCVIANEHGMWMGLSAREVVPVSNFCAIGSGREFALGALHALDFSETTPEHGISLAIAAASAYDFATGSEFEIWTNTITPPVKSPPKRGKASR